MQTISALYPNQPIPIRAKSTCSTDSRRDIERDEEELLEIWPSCPVAIVAYEVLDSDHLKSTEVFKSLLEFCIERGQSELVVLNLEHLVEVDADHSAVSQMYRIKRILFEACRQLGIQMPRLLLVRSDENLDLRIYLRKQGHGRSNVINFPKIPRRGERPGKDAARALG